MQKQLTTPEPKTHTLSLGTIVKVDIDLSQPGTEEGIEVNLSGTCRLYIVGKIVDGSGTPLYVVSDLPAVYPTDKQPLEPSKMLYRSLATVVEYVYEDDVWPTGLRQTLCPSIYGWLQN